MWMGCWAGWNGFSGKLDAIEIQVDRGDGKGFSLLTIDTTTGYTDSASPRHTHPVDLQGHLPHR